MEKLNDLEIDGFAPEARVRCFSLPRLLRFCVAEFNSHHSIDELLVFLDRLFQVGLLFDEFWSMEHKGIRPSVISGIPVMRGLAGWQARSKTHEP